MSERSIVDFETDAIESRPRYPPKPVGVAIKLPGRKSKYYAWGHPTENNCDIYEARERVREAYRHRTVFHNSGFDMDVSECYLGLKPEKFDDTVYLGFLNDPYERELKLKPLAHKHLGIAPEEQEDLRDWIQSNIPEARKAKTKWGEYISRAPAGLVGRYATGDTDRTGGLYDHLLPSISDRGMLAAYHRELAVTPITLEMERSGVRVNAKGLRKALSVFEKLDHDIMLRIQRSLGVSNGQTLSKEFNLNSAQQLGRALLRAGKLSAVVKTKTGQISTKIANLRATCTDKGLLDLLAVHSVCDTYINTFIKPWIIQSEVNDGRILPRFNQVPNDGGGGARSGRYSSYDPNFQNVPADVEESQNKETLLLLQRWLNDECDYQFLGLRDFIMPDEGMVMVCVDYSQQELRFLAHFLAALVDDTVLSDGYAANPDMDIHEFVRQLIYAETDKLYERKHVKITVFGIVYGMGVEKLAARLGISKEEAYRLRKAIFKAVPGIPKLMDYLKTLADKDEPLTTWGGRQYHCEPPIRICIEHSVKSCKRCGKFDDWKTISFAYKMLNYQIQPSAADCTKQGMRNVKEDCGHRCRIAVQVHDELMVMAPSEKWGPRIAQAMCDVKLRVPMLAEPKYSRETWARAKKLDEKKAA